MLLKTYKIITLSLISAIFLVINNIPTFAQEASGLSIGKPLETIRKPGEVFLAGTKGDWNVRCIVGNPGDPDRCEIQQLLFIDEKTPIADISIFKLLDGQPAIAAANVMVPLETLLTKKFRVAFSEKIVKEFPFSFCNNNGCLVRMGLIEEDIKALETGASAEFSITHISNPETALKLRMSLIGFTAAFNAIKPF